MSPAAEWTWEIKPEKGRFPSGITYQICGLGHITFCVSKSSVSPSVKCRKNILYFTTMDSTWYPREISIFSMPDTKEAPKIGAPTALIL